MSLPDSYTQKPGAIPAYFDAILNAQAPDRFSTRFLTNLGFKSTNDRLFISILKDLGFLDTDGNPTERYFAFHDRSQWQRVLAEGVREAYSDLFKVNQNAHELDPEDVTNKLRTLYAGSKSDQVINRIARTFTGLCEIADFDTALDHDEEPAAEPSNDDHDEESVAEVSNVLPKPPPQRGATHPAGRLSIQGLQYHINIALPESRDQAVYDAIFRSLREHLE